MVGGARRRRRADVAGPSTATERASHAGVPASPMRLLEMLTDRFGVFEALAHSTIKLNRCTSADELAMDPQVAEAVLEFADDLRTARAAEPVKVNETVDGGN
jgi:hypothetical protein